MAVMKRFLSGAAVLALGCFIAAPAADAATLVNKNPEKKILGLPAIQCAPAQLSYVIDGGNVKLMCGGKSAMVGHGWVNYVWPGAVNSNYYYVSAKFGEDLTEKISVYPTITLPGLYEVWVSYRGSENRSAATPFFVYADDNKTYRVVVNQKEAGAGALFSAKLGSFYFKKHALSQSPRLTGIVACVNEGAGSSESLDAVFVRYAAPLTPAGLTASDAASDTAVDLSWSAVPGVKAYRIYRSATNVASTAKLLAEVAAPALTYSDTRVTPDTTYFYWIKALGALNKLSAISAVEDGSTAPTPPPQ